ncbi:phosphatidate cytidylyltransferase [Planctopirus limnophila DSM 3776]|uniref:Phosphatidate cytidylyltransferase n=3 Tax=Planctopirus TaxID=1649480 RepID=D5SU75_PLAL2|nr:phosphatidate cytidylyltransferase [Planctopirus hydrillae]ADG69128.1 phosphatidate cytidylyltransferase [Planctopirus limnophila DSM 3776]ODA34429.1 phosphatidate cytidylyltransferase [Planctopirus hydrillae]
MLRWRLAMSAVLIPLLAGIFALDHSFGSSAPILLVFGCVLAYRGADELCDLLHTRNFTPHRFTVCALSMLVTSAAWFGRSRIFPIDVPDDGNTLAQVMLAYSLSILIMFFVSAYRYREPGKSMETLGAELMIVSYVGVLLGVCAQLRWVAGAEAGYLVMASLVIVTKAGDAGAYTLGRLFGRRKLVPLLSPGKTYAGAGGALLGSALGAYLWLTFATPFFNATWQPPEWYWTVLYGVIIGIVGLIGDLCESLIKRDVGKKDSAGLLPGFGGLLDLLDSIIYSAPVAYILWKAIPLATWKIPGA